MIIIGHRGARALEPENTVRAVRKGMGCADLVEIDVRQSLDGVPVVIHDPALERTTDGTGRVRDSTLEELRKLDAGLGERIPTLAEVLALSGGQGGLVVEIKEEGTEEAVCREIRRADLSGVLIISFSGSSLERVKDISPGLRTGFITPRPEPDPVTTAVSLGARVLLPRKDLLSAPLVSRAHGMGLRVFPWVLNTEEEWVGARALGADGFATDDPCQARSWRDAG